MLSQLLNAKPAAASSKVKLLDLPQEMLEHVMKCIVSEDLKGQKAARAVCSRLRKATNAHVKHVKVESHMEGGTLPDTLLPQLKSIALNVAAGNRGGLWSADNLALLGVQNAPKDCSLAIDVDAAILDLSDLKNILDESGLLPRVTSLSHQGWGLEGEATHFGPNVEVFAKLKLVRAECIDNLMHNTLEHDNLVSLTFAPAIVKAWTLHLVREINTSAGKTLRTLAINFRPFQQVTLLPLAEAKLPALEHLELRTQNEHGFGADALQPLASADLPILKSVVIEMTGSGRIAHMGEFLRPLVRFPGLESIEIWASTINSFAGLWGVGVGGVHLPNLRRLSLRVDAKVDWSSRAIFTSNPLDKAVDAFAGLTLDRLDLHDIGLPQNASAPGIKQLALTNPRWEDLRTAMSPQFSPDLKVIRVGGPSARAMRTRMETCSPVGSPEAGWRLGGAMPAGPGMHKARSFVVLHDLKGGEGPSNGSRGPQVA